MSENVDVLKIDDHSTGTCIAKNKAYNLYKKI